MNRAVSAALLLIVFLAPATTGAKEKRLVTAEEVAEHLARWAKPTYPALARATRLQGEVVILATISKSGVVGDLKVKSGHPLLAPAAMEAVLLWHFRPFLEDGKPEPVQALLKVQFPPGDAPGEFQASVDTVEQFYTTLEGCRDETRENNFIDAEALCKKAIDQAAALDEHHQLERMDACQQMGHVFFLQKKYAEALEQYQKELAIATASVEPWEVTLAAAHQHVANGLWATAKKEEARVEYEQAENTYEQSREHTDSAFLKNEYAKGLKGVLHDHATLLRQMGLKEEAAFVEGKSAAIVINQAAK
jgi:TonB family protein